jgi:PadR family transcriptional regulator PadR
MKLTPSTLEVALALLDSPTSQHYGYELSKKTHLRSGVLYPILQRMYDEGWLSDGWEYPTPKDRPARRYYQITPEGISGLSAMRIRAASDFQFARRYPEVARYA